MLSGHYAERLQHACSWAEPQRTWPPSAILLMDLSVSVVAPS